MNDPHQLHGGGGTGSSAGQLSTNAQQAFYSPQMLLQQQYMQMPSLYTSQQVLQPHQVDMQAFQQQQQLLQVMQQQHQQQQQALQNQQRNLTPHDSQNVALQQQQHYQRALQQAAQQQQQQRQLEQQRLMEQQQRQLDRMHQEREAARLQQQQQQEEMQRQKAQEVARQQHEEMQRRLAYQKEQQLKLQREAHERMLLEQQRLKEEQRKQEEAQRLAEEARKREEEERRELEKVMAVREEQKRKQKEALEAHTAMREKAESIPINIHLGGCHALTKLVSHLPFPSPFLPHSSSLKVNVHPDMDSQLAQSDANIAQYLADAISQIDVADVSLKHTEGESNDLDSINEPFLIKNILAFNARAFDVEPPVESTSDECIPMEILSSELKEEAAVPSQEQSTADGNGAVDTEDSYTQPSTSMQHDSQKEGNSMVVEAPKENTAPMEAAPTPPRPKPIQDQDQTQLRKQIVSLGKQPKAQQGRKKKDMVESLYDSLTGYFDPSEGRRRRQRTKTFEEEQHEKKQLELIAQMEMAEASEKKTDETHKGGSEVEHRPGHAGTSGEELLDEDEKPKFFASHKRGRKRQREPISEPPDRPPTPTEIIQQRENEWRERQRKRQEKHKRRQNDSESDCWNNEVMAEKESYAKFTSIIDQIFDNVEDLDIVGGAEDEEAEIPQELLIDKHQLEELRKEAQKLKSWKRINKVHPDRLVKLLTILEKNIRDVIAVEGSQPLIPFFDDADDDESDETYRELVDDRILRAADASCTAMMIMTSTKMPKQVYIEDTIDRSIQLCKQFLQHIIYPASDALCRSPSKARKAEDKKRRKTQSHARSQTLQKVYARITELVGCFAELVRTQQLTETAVLHLCTVGCGPFFVDNTGELQLQAIKLLSAICARYEDFRNTIIQDLLNSLHRLPSTKNAKNSYRMSADDWVSNLTVLVMQLVQSAVKVPRRRRSDEGQQPDPNEEAANADAVVKESFRQSQNMAKMFLSSFLGKCTAKSEEDYRRLFDQFLHDLLAALYKPEWPAAEMMLSTLGTLLIASYRSKSIDMSLRVACLDYLGTITARHRKDLHHTVSDDVRLDMVVKVLVYDELDESEQTGDVNAVDISHLSGADKMRKVQRALIDYLVEKKGDADVSIEYAVMFYVGEWYKEVYEEGESAKQKLKQALNSSELSDKEKRKFEKKTERVLERCQLMKDFFMKTADKKQMRKRAEHIARTGNILMDSDAMWLVKYLASNREFSQSFDMYLKQILMGIHIEGAVGLRTKAMRCLTLIIESDPEVLRIPEVQKAVQVKMMDQNAAVREATIELVGKYVIAKPDVLPQYYEILIERVKDSGVAVRKRVIRIMREMCEKQPNFEKIPEMLSRIVRRISDEEGVKKLTVETFQTLWFQPTRERDSVTLVRKVMSMTEMVQICVKENSVEFFEQLLHCLLRGGDRALLCASRQMIDTLVDNVLTLDSKIASDESKVNGSTEESTSLNAAAAHASHQERLLACLTTLSLFSKVRPDLMVKHAETLQPYLSMSITSPSEQQVMNQVINMLERVVPLMEHPSESFLKSLDDGLCTLVKDSGMRIISSALACISAIYNKWKKRRPAVIETFLSYLRFLNQMRDDVENKPGHSIPPEKGPIAQRSLYSIGLMCRHFDVDTILEGDMEARKNLSAYCSLRQSNAESTANHVRVGGDEEDSDHTAASKKLQPYKEDVFQVLSFFSRNRDGAIRMKALNALGNFTATHADFLLRREMRNMYVTLLNVDDQEYLNLKIQTLKNLELFLMAEESKMVKNNDEWNKAKEGQDLKEMELANSGLASTIIQIYWAAILSSYYNQVDAVRMAAVQVTVLTLGQGLVTPGSSIPTLIAMSTDSIAAIRNKVGNLLKDIDSKYAGMVPSKAVSGIRCSFRLQRHLKREQGTPVRGIRACDPSAASGAKGAIRMEHGVPKMTNDGQAILSGLYQSLRINRQQRRSFLTSVLRLFSEDCREKLSLEEWVFVADNIAMFPYQVLDEPLYVIRHIESIVSVSGQNIINSFKMQLMPRPGNAEPLDDDSEFDPELIYRRLPEDKSLLYECMKNSQACFLLLYLKNFLMKLYSFSEAKVQEYSPSEAAKVYEKALSTRKNIAMFYPQTALQELRPEAAHQRDTVNGHINMANQIVYFRNMLLSLDRADDDEDVAEENTTVNHRDEDSEEEETAVDEERGEERVEVTSSANEQPDH